MTDVMHLRGCVAERLAVAHTGVAMLEPCGQSESYNNLSDVPATVLGPPVRSMPEVFYIFAAGQAEDSGVKVAA